MPPCNRRKSETFPTRCATIARLPPHSVPLAEKSAGPSSGNSILVARACEERPAMIVRERGRPECAEIVGRHRPGEADDPGVRPRRKLKCGEVAVTEPARLRRRNRIEIDPVQQPGPAVAAAHGDSQIDARIRCHAHDRGQPLVVGRRKRCQRVDAVGSTTDAVPERLEAFGRARYRFGLDHKAGRRVQPDAVGGRLHPRASRRRDAKNPSSAAQASAATPPVTVV